MKRVHWWLLIGSLALSLLNVCAQTQEFAKTGIEDMKLSKAWKTLSRDQRRAWNAWARSNKVLLDDGSLRYVSGHKAMTVILRNRAIAGEAANPTVVPAAFPWMGEALSVNDAGPFCENLGYVGFRTMVDLPDATKWFVWATPPLDGSVADPQRSLRFVKCMALTPFESDLLTPSIGNDYAAVNGSWRGPNEDGGWPTDHFVWFRLHEYANGQLGPGFVMKGRIQVEL